ncbi:MAG: hypothetical protein LJE58_17035, partial [Thiogranum sp.]|nr:hypothetical protein [Thiogranum sp.]
SVQPMSRFIAANGLVVCSISAIVKQPESEDSVFCTIRGSETSQWFWLFSGKIESLAVFGALSVIALFSYWPRFWPVLKASD